MYSATEVAQKINESLKSKGLSQKDMLSSCELSKNAISSMLSRGSMLRADNLAKIADYIGCSIDHLMGRENTTTVGFDINSTDKKLLDDFHKLDSRDQREVLAIISYKLDESKKANYCTSTPDSLKSLA